MSRYGLAFSAGPDWVGEAASLPEAIRAAEAQTGRRVVRGRGLDHYVEPTDAERAQRREDGRAIQRALADSKLRGMRVAGLKTRASRLGVKVEVSPSGLISLWRDSARVMVGGLTDAEEFLGVQEAVT